MSSEEIASKLTPTIESLLKCLKYALKESKPECGFGNTDLFYLFAYKLGRYMHMYPNYLAAFTEDDKKAFLENFPKAFVTIVGYTPGLTSNIDPSDMNIAKQRVSEMSFLKNEMFQLYKELNNGVDLSIASGSSEEAAVHKLQDRIAKLLNQIEVWSDPSYPSDDYAEQVPDLNGVPLSHFWWTDQHRDMWKTKTES